MTRCIAFLLLCASATAQALPPMPWENPDRALLAALHDNDLGKFKRLLKGGANPNALFMKKVGLGHEAEWVMCDATDKGKLEFLKLAVQYGGNVNLRHQDAFSGFSAPIFCAISLYHNDEAVYYLADQGADLTIKECPACGGLGGTPLTAPVPFYRLVYWMLERRGGTVTEDEFKILILWIENSGYFLEDGTLNPWGVKVTDYLRERGYKVTPWDGTYVCPERGHRRPICRQPGIKRGDRVDMYWRKKGMSSPLVVPDKDRTQSVQ